MAFTFEQLFAADPSNPANIAQKRIYHHLHARLRNHVAPRPHRPRRLGRTEKTPAIPNPYNSSAAMNLYADSLHPADAGHGYIADMLLPLIMPR